MSSENNEELSINNCLEEEGEGRESAPSSFQEFAIGAELDGHRLDSRSPASWASAAATRRSSSKEGNAKLTPERRIKPSVKVAAGDALGVIVPPAETPRPRAAGRAFRGGIRRRGYNRRQQARRARRPHPRRATGAERWFTAFWFRYPDLGALNGVQRPGIVHRLDATTSGLMVVARNGLAQEGLFQGFQGKARA